MLDPLIGKQLNNFHIEKLLGQGGMAKVYYGTDIGLNRPVAIKVIDERWREDTQFTARFISEAQTIATWRHDNIIQVYYAGHDDDIYYFVMEYIEGDDLTNYIHDQQIEGDLVPYDTTVTILRSIASALDYAHGKGVIHRDVKPSNIMMGDDGRVVLMDFGLALDVQKGTIGETFGTPHYIAPEQARDSSTAVAESDQYALGVIAYEMLTGQVPFDNPSAMTVAMMHMTEPPPIPTSINPNLTPDVEKVLLKVLSKEPENRFPSCRAFVETLEQTILGRPTLIDDVSLTEMGKILITPPAQSATETVSAKSDKPETSAAKKSRLPITLLAVAVLAIIGIILMLVINNSGTSSIEPTESANVAQSISFPTETIEIPATLVSTNTVIPPTATIMQANTEIPPTATYTSLPPTETLIPTNTNLPPTATPMPSDTTIPPTATDSPPTLPAAPTLAYPNGSPVILYYNNSSFYVWNPTSDRIRAGQFKFEAIDSTGNTLAYAFDGFKWTQFYSFIDGGNCAKIELTSGSNFRPAECQAINSEVNLQASDTQLFWIPQDNISGFRVLWLDEVIALCSVTEEQCTFNIP